MRPLDQFTPFGVFTDERYQHVVDQNDRIAEGLTQSLLQPVELGRTLVAVRRTSGGAIESSFDTGAPVMHDLVVLAIPSSASFGIVALHPNLGIPPAQQTAINTLGYGQQREVAGGIRRSPLDRSAQQRDRLYLDLPHHQLSWETNRARS